MGRKTVSFSLLMIAVTVAGASSLIYEVLWIRQLGFALGSTIVATSIMLTAFLGGLAIGSWAMGKKADKLKQPARTFAVVEVLAALTGVLSIPALAYAGRAYVLIATTMGATGFSAMILRSLFALIIMAIPAILFGMTFPLATVIGARLKGSEIAAGAVSAASSFGSAFGALACGLWLEPTLGLFASAVVASALNVFAAASVYAVLRLSVGVLSNRASRE